MKRKHITKTIIILVLLVLTALAILPLYWMVINSFQPNSATMKIPPELFPSNITLENYHEVIFNRPALRWTFNSVLMSTIRMLLTLYICSLAAYPLAKKKFPGSKFLFWLIIGFMTVPRQVLLLPLFMTMKNWNLFDTNLALLLPNIAWPIGVFLMKQTMQTIPNEILEAAKADGCSEFRLFNQILLPMVKGGLGALAIFAFTNMWGDYMWQLIIIKSTEKRPLPLGIATLAEEFVSNYGYQLAAATIGAIPLLILFLMFQKYFAGGVTVGAVKG